MRCHSGQSGRLVESGVVTILSTLYFGTIIGVALRSMLLPESHPLLIVSGSRWHQLSC